MLKPTRAALCAAVSMLACIQSAKAEPYILNVPIGQYGSPTSRTTVMAQEQIKNVPGGAAVVPAKEFQEKYTLTVKDMLQDTPGVLAQPRYGEESRLSIRGSGLSRSVHLRGITLLQNGIPFNFADGSGDFQEIDPLILQHLEVYRGGQALQYGAATLGGAINMVTPTARTVDYNTLMRAEAGSDKTTRLHMQAAKVFKDADILATVTSAKSDGYRQQSGQDNLRFSGNAGVKLGDDAETRFYLNWNDINQELPGTVTKDEALHNPTAVPAINIGNDYSRDVRSLRLANRTAFELDNGIRLEAGGYVNDKSLYHPIFQVIDQDSVDVGGFARGTMSVQSHDIVFGINAGHGVNDAKRFFNDGGDRAGLTADAKQIADNLELYGEDTYEFAPQWNLIGGMQARVAWRDYTDNLNHANDDDKVYRAINPKIGLIYEIDRDSEIYASINRSSEAPTYSELVQGALPGFVPVDQQSAWTAEIGTRGRHDAFSWDATLYHARVRDELLNFTVTPDVPASVFNAQDTIHQGIELGLGWQATNEISFRTVYTLNDFRFDDDAQYGDNDLAGAPPHQINLSARYERDGFYVEPHIEWVPEAAWVDYANTLKADSYVLTNVKGGWEMNDSVSFFLDGRNLTNEKTIPSFTTITDARTAATNVFYPGDGRTVFGGISVKF